MMSSCLFCPPPLHLEVAGSQVQLGLGSAVRLPVGVRGSARPQNHLFYILSQEKLSGTNRFWFFLCEPKRPSEVSEPMKRQIRLYYVRGSILM